jgi:spermidine/putrescine transport system permease protein
MSTVTERPVLAPKKTVGAFRPVAWVRKHVIAIIAWLVFAFLLAPNLVVVVMSFNQPLGKFNYQWHKFSFAAWLDPMNKGQLSASLVLSLEIALLATLVATILGTMIAFAIVRHGFKGRSSVNTILFLPMAAPEIIMGTTLLTLFLNTVGSGFLGFWTILIAHIMFCLSFVVTAVKARVMSMDPRLEQAAQDLYAGPAQTFLRVTLPIAAPGIAAGALLAFALALALAPLAARAAPPVPAITTLAPLIFTRASSKTSRIAGASVLYVNRASPWNSTVLAAPTSRAH